MSVNVGAFVTRTLNQDAAAATGNGVNTQTRNFSTLTCRVTTNSAWNGTITFEISIDETNFTSIRGVNLDNGQVVSTHTTANVTDHYSFNVPGALVWRARVSTYVAGTATVESVIQPVVGTPFLPAVDSSGAISLAAGTNNIGDVDVLTQVGAASIATGQITVANTETSIAASRATRRSILITQHGTTDVFLGPTGVTTSNGLKLDGTDGANVGLNTTAEVFGIVAAGTQVVSFIETFD